jgi:ribosomal protein S18 acetylase RimI-like enzyme
MGQEDQPAAYSYRRATNDDYDFLYALHVAAMREYVELLWGWEEKWQQEYFARKFDPQIYQIIQIEGRDAGVVVVERRENTFYIALLEIMPEFQGRGTGTAVINELCDQARAGNLPMMLHVLKSNDLARRLYERLGFVVVSEEEHRFKMIKETTSAVPPQPD